MMAELRGQVRYRFRADEHDVHVVLEGEASWVKTIFEHTLSIKLSILDTK